MRTYRLITLMSMIWPPALLTTVENALALEKANYTVVTSEAEFELRQYAPQIVAETHVEGDFDEVGNIGFRRLFAYISGENRKQESIAMTAPVSQEPTSEKIAMTAPVSQERQDDKWVINFLVPSQYTFETVPQPLDPKVMLRQIPERLIAAYKYSGTWSQERYQKNEDRLRTWIRARNLQPVGEPIFARYDPPFMPWFLRRNEVLIPVERPQP